MVQRKRLKNGVRLVVEPMEHVRSVAIGIWIKAGSRDEGKEENGITHFLEHMLFKGTKRRTAAEIAAAFDRIGGHVNAFTAKECTCFYTKVIDTHALEALDILSDMFFEAQLAEEEIEKERQVILEEIRMVEDTPDDIIHDDLSHIAYGDQTLGLPILGTEKSVLGLDKKQIEDYRKEQYRPENVVISIAGKVEESLLHAVETHFSDYQSTDHPEEQPGTQGRETIWTAKKHARAKTVEQAHLCLGYKGLPTGHKDMYALLLLNQMLGGSMSSRLFQDIREQRGLAYSVFSYHIDYRDTGMLTIYAGTAPNHLSELLTAATGVVESFASEKAKEEELENVKAHVQGSMILGLESTGSRMSRNGKNELMLGYHRSLDEVTARIDQVTTEDIQNMAHFLVESDYALALISPDGKLPV